MRPLVIIALVLLTAQVFGQSNTVAAGGNEFTIGQVFQQTAWNNGWSVMEGIQQPYEINVHTAIDQNNQGEISVYPNPVKDVLNVVSVRAAQYTILDINGRKMMQGIAEKGINVSRLTPGIYFVRIENKNFKIIKL